VGAEPDAASRDRDTCARLTNIGSDDAMKAQYILAVAAAVFLAAALMRVSRGGAARHPQTRTWMTIAVIFGAVSAWLFYRS
jgi:hypothetical protein